MVGSVAPNALLERLFAREHVRAALLRHDLGAFFALARKWSGISYMRDRALSANIMASMSHLALPGDALARYSAEPNVRDFLDSLSATGWQRALILAGLGTPRADGCVAI